MKKLTITIIALSLGIPQVTFAAWWNPISWFRNNQNTENIKQSDLVPYEGIAVDKNPKKVTESPARQDVVEKTVTKVIEVDNPVLQARIDALVKQNDELNSRISSYISRLNECREQTPTKSATLTAKEEKEQKLADIDVQILYKIDRYLSATGGTTTFNDGSTSNSFITEINLLLESYRVVDERMLYKNLPPRATFQEGKENMQNLKNYLVDSYIKYR